MKFVYLPGATADLLWFRRYYEAVFPEGAGNAARQIKTAKAAIKAHPEIGQKLDDLDLRAFQIARTPFALIYRIREDRIEVLRLLDGRADPSLR